MNPADQAGRQAPQPGVVRVMGLISHVCGVVAALMILASVLITCQMIWVRGVLNQSSIWQTEVVIYLMISATLIGLPWVQRQRGHVNVDLLPIWLGNRLRRVLAALTLAASIVLMAVMFWFGFGIFHEAWTSGETSGTVWDAPMWVPYLAMPVGFGLFLLQLAVDLYAMIVGADRPFGLPDKP